MWGVILTGTADAALLEEVAATMDEVLRGIVDEGNAIIAAYRLITQPLKRLAGGDGASRAINAVDAFVFPNLRTFTVRLSTSF